MSHYFTKSPNGYAERLRFVGDDWYVWEAKEPNGDWGNSHGLTSYAGHESTFSPPLSDTDKEWARSNAK